MVTKPVTMTLDLDTLAYIDKERGLVSRSKYVNTVIQYISDKLTGKIVLILMDDIQLLWLDEERGSISREAYVRYLVVKAISGEDDE